MEYQDRHWNIDRREEGTWNGRRRDGGAKSTLRIKEQEKRLTLNEHDDDDDDDWSSPYRTVNTLHLSYKNQSVNVV